MNATNPRELPDPSRLDRHSRAPEKGSRLLFFGGGTALKEVSRELTRFTHNSIHLLTPFDSGGSSAHLRAAFGMIAVGDLRNRIMALADRSTPEQSKVCDILTHRFSTDTDNQTLLNQLKSMISGEHRLSADVVGSKKDAISGCLHAFLEQMPVDFALRGASIGNLVLTGMYFSQNRNIETAIAEFSSLAESRGVVRPVSSDDLHLCSELEDGQTLAGQHILTRGGEDAIRSPVRRVFLSESMCGGDAVCAIASSAAVDLIQDAEVICYPMGSFYSSLIASIMPTGIAKAIAKTDAPKVYIPNRGLDPEQIGMSLSRSIEVLTNYLRSDGDAHVDKRDLVHHVFVDSTSGSFSSSELDSLRRLGVDMIDIRATTSRNKRYWDSVRLAEELVSLA